ncbi:MAG: molybdate ABC transporter substrate-binding protein [Bryobacteraceae bacterium]
MSSFLIYLVLGYSASLAQQPLLIAAASDLAPAEARLAAEASKHLGVPVRFVLGSSGQLASQIRNGAPYDVYLSANRAFVEDLARTGHLAPDSVRTYATGRLAIYSRGGKIHDVAALAERSIRHVAIANPAHAPYGVAAKQFLERAGLWERLAGRIVYGENVRQTFQFAETGNADAAMVAWTLVKDKGGVLVTESGHDPIAQGAGVVARSGQSETGRRFIEWLLGSEGQGVIQEAGLFPPNTTPVAAPKVSKRRRRD